MSSVPVGKGRAGEPGRPIALIGGVFLLLTLLFTYPIWTAPDTVLNELGDVRLNAWILAWDAHALISQPLELFDANIFFPNDNTLAFSEHLFGSAIWVAPVNWAGHPVLAYNLIFLSSFILTGIGTTLWVRHLTGSLAAGLLAGVVWTFAPAKFDHLPQIQMLTGQWIPFALLFCGRYVETGLAKYAWAMAGFAGLQFITSVYYGMFLIPVLGVYGLLVALVLPGSEALRRPRRTARDLAVAGVILALFVVPFSVPYFSANQEYGFERGHQEIVYFSAQTKAFLSAGWPSRTPHMAWLHRSFRAPEANLFPGILVSLLAAAGIFLAVRLAAGALRSGDPEKVAAGALRSGDPEKVAAIPPSAWPVSRAAAGKWIAIAAAALWVFHFVGLWVAWWWSRPPVFDLVIDASQALSPSLWLSLAAGIAVAFLPTARLSGDAGRRGSYLIVVAYMALLTYLLAMGPEVRGWNFNLGSGPYWLLYWMGPFQGIRGVARIGLLWVLFVAALAGFAFAALVERRRPAFVSVDRSGPDVRSGSLVWVLLAVLVGVVVWEYRVWPIPNEIADPREDPAYEWLAEQPGESAVVHVPLQPGRQWWRETRYQLGSTLHWRPLVNGYSGFSPDDYQRLVDEVPLSQGFFELLRQDFPVQYVVVHRRLLSSNEQRANLARLRSGSRDADIVADLGDTFVFSLRADWERGPVLRRRFEADALENKKGIRFFARLVEDSEVDEVVLAAAWGDEPRRPLNVGRDWEVFELPIPEEYIDRLAGRPGLFEAHPTSPVSRGQESALLVSEFVLDLQDGSSGVGAGSRWYALTDSLGFHVYLLREFGFGVRERLEFPPTARGATDMADYLSSVPEGSLVGVAIGFDGFETLPEPLLPALRTIGAEPPSSSIRELVVLGWKGAPPGQALQAGGNQPAFIKIDSSSAAIEVRGISIHD